MLNATWRALPIGFMVTKIVGDRGRVEVVAEEWTNICCKCPIVLSRLVRHPLVIENLSNNMIMGGDVG